MGSEQRKTRILMLPWLAHGHISPFLELAKKLAKRNFVVYFCSTPINLNPIREKLDHDHRRPRRSDQDNEDLHWNESIQLVELHLPSLLDLPPRYHTTNSLPPHLMQTLKDAFAKSAIPNFLNILRALSPDLLIYDFLQTWAPALASSFGIPAVEFMTSSACMTAFLNDFYGFPGATFPFSEIYLMDYEVQEFSRLGCETVFECMRRSSEIVLIKTFREIEGEYLDLLSSYVGKRFVPVGPLVQELNAWEEGNYISSYRVICAQEDDQYVHDDFSDTSGVLCPFRCYDSCRHEIIQSSVDVIRWLDAKDPMSTVFASFGSEYFLSKEEIQEIAIGLDLSNTNFIWAIRSPNGDHQNETTIEHNLPKGFLRRTRDRGLVVEGWVPQMEILGHPSIGGFVSHCGWSSIMESVSLGVPVIAMPMHLDQPINARLLTRSLGVGIEVERGDDGRPIGEKIGDVIKEVMMRKRGESARRGARELSEIIVGKGDEDVDQVVNELIQILTRSKQDGV
ncbi:UDP-glucosyltransferase 29-like protein [Drosera capensis]